MLALSEETKFFPTFEEKKTREIEKRKEKICKVIRIKQLYLKGLE